MKSGKFLKTALVFTLFFLCTAIFPYVQVYGEDDYEYTFDTGIYGNLATVTDCRGFGESTTIPDHCTAENDYGYDVEIPVKSLWHKLFSACGYLKRATITAKEELEIFEDTFSDCASLEELLAAPGSYYESEAGILYGRNKKELIRCPEGKTGYVRIPAGVAKVWGSAFSQCANLTGIRLSDSITYIGIGAFYNCKNLESMIIPAGISGIGKEAFSGCLSLQDIYFECSREEAAEIWYINDIYAQPDVRLGDYEDIEYGMRVSWGLSEDVRIHFGFDPDSYKYCVRPDGTAEITGYTGKDSVLLVPSQVDGLRVAAIRDRAFSGNVQIAGIELPDGVKSIGNYAFYGCSGLKYICLPESLEELGSKALNSCKNLQDIYFAGNMTNWKKLGFSAGSAITVYTNCRPSDYLFVVLEDGTAGISGYAGTSAEPALPGWLDGKPVTRILESAFDGCSRLRGISIPKSIVSIEKNAFWDCGRLASVRYSGSRKQWLGVAVASGNDALKKAALDCADKTQEVFAVYQVSFQAWGVKDYPVQRIEEYSLAKNPGEPARPEYRFLGWYFGEKEWDFQYDKVREDMVLTARWEPVEKVTSKHTDRGLSWADEKGFVLIPPGLKIDLNRGRGEYSGGNSKYIGTRWRADSNVVSPGSGSGERFSFQGVKAGTCTITAEVTTELWGVEAGDNKLTRWDVSTTPYTWKYRIVPYITAITMEKKSLTLREGEACPLVFSTVPAGNYSRVLSGLRFTSSDPAVAAITDDGIVIAKGRGTAVITADTREGANGRTCTASCRITVTKAEKPAGSGTAENPDKESDQGDKKGGAEETGKDTDRDSTEKETGTDKTAAAGEEKFQAALKSYRDDKDCEALKLFRESAKKGHGFAMYYIAFMYETGKGVEASEKSAFQWYQKSAETGNPAGQFKTAYYYDIGKYVEKDASKAVEWYQKAVVQTEYAGEFQETYSSSQPEEILNTHVLNSMYNLAWKYQNGQGTKRDYKKAMELYRQCADAGDDVAMYRIGQLYENGRGVKKSIDLALKWYKKAEKLGNKSAASRRKKLEAASGGMQ